MCCLMDKFTGDAILTPQKIRERKDSAFAFSVKNQGLNRQMPIAQFPDFAAETF